MRLSRTMAVAWRIGRQFTRDRRTIALLFLVPIAVMSLLVYLLQGPTVPPPVAIIANDQDWRERVAGWLETGANGVTLVNLQGGDFKKALTTGDVHAVIVVEASKAESEAPSAEKRAPTGGTTLSEELGSLLKAVALPDITIWLEGSDPQIIGQVMSRIRADLLRGLNEYRRDVQEKGLDRLREMLSQQQSRMALLLATLQRLLPPGISMPPELAAEFSPAAPGAAAAPGAPGTPGSPGDSGAPGASGVNPEDVTPENHPPGQDRERDNDGKDDEKNGQEDDLLEPFVLKTLHGGEEFSSTDYWAPGLIAFFAFFLVFLLTSVSFLRERLQGTLVRLLASPIGRTEMMLGYMIGFSLFALIQALVILVFIIYVLQVHQEGNLGLIFLVEVILTVGAVNLGIFLSTFARNELQVVQFIPLVILPQGLLSGLLVSLDTMPRILALIAKAMPLTYAVDALRAIMVRGAGVTDIAVQLGVLTGFMLLFTLAGALTLSRQVE